MSEDKKVRENCAEECQSCSKFRLLSLLKGREEREEFHYTVALAGNPNTGKSTVFNALTGLRQHTGNWPGKTVARAEGYFDCGDKTIRLVDLPGTYSLLSMSTDEEIARNYILFEKPDLVLVVMDATRLESNLNLAFQIFEITDRVMVCLNLMDEAERRGLEVDHKKLSEELGVPVVPTAARRNRGLDELVDAIGKFLSGELSSKPKRLAVLPPSLEKLVVQIEEKVGELYPGLASKRWVALRLLEGDPTIVEAIRGDRLGQIAEDGGGPVRVEESGGDSPSLQRISAKGENVVEGKESPDSTGQTESLKPSEEGKKYDRKRALEEFLNWIEDERWRHRLDIHSLLVEAIFRRAEEIRRVVVKERERRLSWERTLDRLATSPFTGFLLMLFLFTLIFWLTIAGANYPSQLLHDLLIGKLYPLLKSTAQQWGIPAAVAGPLIDGGYLAMAWVVSVMFPPMAIFFPLFTFLEDLGYLPRVAFNLDRLFRWAGGHGKQALSMMMGFGCNAAGVIATRVIDSPRERLLAIITNNFALCNGRWPTQILLATLFLGALAPPALASTVAALSVVAVALLGVLLTFATSWFLSRTVLKGEPAAFRLELPPYRPPNLLQILYTSFIDRTIFVLWRAIVFAFPSGVVIWAVANIQIAEKSLSYWLVKGLDPIGYFVGLNGIIILAYIIAIPANEIIIPTVLMLTALHTGILSAEGGVLFEPSSSMEIMKILKAGGWTVLTALNVMLFSLIHNPCSTTIYTIYKETGSKKWTLLATFLPLAMGFFVTFMVKQIWNILGL